MRRRRLLGAALAALALGLMLSWLASGPSSRVAPIAAADTLTPAPALSSTDLPLPTSLPSPTPVPVPTLPPATPPPTPPPTDVPTAAPTAVPTATASPSPASGGSSSSGTSGGTGTSSAGSAPGMGSAAAANGDGAAGSSQSPAASAAESILSAHVPLSLVTADPLLAAQVQAIIANPVAAQRPDLVHFTLASAGTGTPLDGGGSAGATAAGAAGVPAPVLAAGAALVVLLAAALIVRRRFVSQRMALITAPPLAALIAVGLTVGLGGHGAAPSSPGPAVAAAATSIGPGAQGVSTSAPGALLSALRSRSQSLPVGAASHTWTSLVAVETVLNDQHDRLLNDEANIADITRQLSDTGSTAVPQQTRRPAYMGVLRTALQHLVDDHQALVTSYNGSLQQEYNVYVAAAQSPQATSELQLVAVHTPIAVQNAVHTNLDLVQTQLQQEAQIAAAEAQAAAAAQSGAAGLPALALIAGGATPSFHAPVSGVVSQPFGPTQFALEPPLTYNGVFYPHFHTGLDIAAPLDTPLGAAADGVVILATSSVDSQGHLSGYGNYIAIRHSNGFVTLYGHLDRILVSVGQTVQQGQEIGLLGSTGWSTGPHVHFEIRENGVFVDPAPFLAAQIHG